MSNDSTKKQDDKHVKYVEHRMMFYGHTFSEKGKNNSKNFSFNDYEYENDGDKIVISKEEFKDIQETIIKINKKFDFKQSIMCENIIYNFLKNGCISIIIEYDINRYFMKNYQKIAGNNFDYINKLLSEDIEKIIKNNWKECFEFIEENEYGIPEKFKKDSSLHVTDTMVYSQHFIFKDYDEYIKKSKSEDLKQLVEYIEKLKFEDLKQLVEYIKKSKSEDLKQLAEYIEKSKSEDLKQLAEYIEKLKFEDLKQLVGDIEKLKFEDLKQLVGDIEKSKFEDLKQLVEKLKQLVVDTEKLKFEDLEELVEDIEKLKDLAEDIAKLKELDEDIENLKKEFIKIKDLKYKPLKFDWGIRYWEEDNCKYQNTKNDKFDFLDTEFLFLSRQVLVNSQIMISTDISKDILFKEEYTKNIDIEDLESFICSYKTFHQINDLMLMDFNEDTKLINSALFKYDDFKDLEESKNNGEDTILKILKNYETKRNKNSEIIFGIIIFIIGALTIYSVTHDIFQFMPIDKEAKYPWIRIPILIVITIIIYIAADSIARRYKTTIWKEITKLYNKITCSDREQKKYVKK
ncbi:hypothetical protein N5T79_10470 [Aliarcobacter cryaerophilus]|uniref:hypothetical protein n=1 Tax=Aliarcobacter cryaerophilus TaxID=28198 RepID=UPI0021B654C6|nr:hypothetical protein [Aliarcobacter cryaerophilus]MCT7529571.1 hypothetical protein [Aliarcobacter cryaerophilus]